MHMLLSQSKQLEESTELKMPNLNVVAAKTPTPPTALVLGGTGRTGALLARGLVARGLKARTAARRGADAVFDWADPTTYAPALNGVDRVYLVTPVMRIKFAREVAHFLDLAAAAGVRHVTYLSAYGADRAPREVDIRAVELDLARRSGVSHSILRPAWVMQNFSDDHLPVIGGVITAPSGGGKEAFVDAADIAAVAIETLVNSGRPCRRGLRANRPAGADVQPGR